MADIKETIQGLYSLKTYLASKTIEEHGSARESLIGMQKVVDSTVNLLKEQEPKPVELYGKDDWYGLVCVCPDCKAEWMGDESNTHFCPNCGKAVKWNE